ncbi:MAG: prephenate dehydratase [Thiotrichales bacterium]|nr:MAG: prephenate dehydratase [Thiotrichales bacterium]
MQNQTIAFQGTHGAYSEQAIYSNYPKSTKTLPLNSFTDILQAVVTNQANLAILPIENSVAGTVLSAYDALLDFNLHVQKEIVIPINHYLLASKNTNLDKIRNVISHPQALSQCAANIKLLNLEPTAHYDTAGAAAYIADLKDNQTIAAIASKQAAEYYNLQILKSNFADKAFNQTRFFILGNQKPPYNKTKPYKTSIVFTLANKVNALGEVLTIFSKQKIDLRKIESRPSKHSAWDYMFLLDFFGNIEDVNIRHTMQEIESLTATFRILGSYITS